MRLTVDVLVTRGPFQESRHRIQAAVSDADGVLRAGTSSPDLVTSWRSAAKPFQLLPLVERGHAERLGLTDEELAVMAGSHTGSGYHVGLVAGILERAGLSQTLLACGYHEPIDPESRLRLERNPDERSPIYNNCSGKHAGMLCLARSEGWTVEGYEQPDHPVQRLMRVTVAEACGLAPDAVEVAVDGCGVSVFGLPLSRMGLAYARLSAASRNREGREGALARIRSAMQSFPLAVGGKERFSTALIMASGGRLAAKGGAEGLECVALPASRQGLALKCEDGQTRAVAPAVVAILERLGELSSPEAERLAEWRRPTIRNHAGLEVGGLEARVEVL